jgi:hypothetical protein
LSSQEEKDNNNIQQQLQEEEEQEEKTTTAQQELIQEIQDEKEQQLGYILDAGKASKQRVEYLAKQNEYKVAFDNGKTRSIKRKPLSAKKNREIEDLRSAFTSSRNYEDEYEKAGKKFKVGSQEFDNRADILFEAYKKCAIHCLGVTEEEYDSMIWEDDEEQEKKGIFGIKSIIEACMMRSVHGTAYFHQPSKSS